MSTEELTRLGTGRIKLDLFAGFAKKFIEAKYSIAKYVDSTFSL